MKFEKLKQEEKSRPFRVTLLNQSESGRRCEQMVMYGLAGVWPQMSWGEFCEGLAWVVFREANKQGIKEEDFARVVGVTARTVYGMRTTGKQAQRPVSQKTVGILARFVGVEVPKKVAQF